VVALQVLAQSSSLAKGDFEEFYHRAKNTGLAEPSWIALFEPGGRVLFNTLVPYGVILPNSNRPDVLQRIQETRKPHVSDLFAGSLTGQRLVTIDAPSRRSFGINGSPATGMPRCSIAAERSWPAPDHRSDTWGGLQAPMFRTPLRPHRKDISRA
jgi:hypothetical protein